jgi:hypothetical protein
MVTVPQCFKANPAVIGIVPASLLTNHAGSDTNSHLKEAFEPGKLCKSSMKL